MNNKVKGVTEKLEKMIQSYLGRQDYGDLRLGPGQKLLDENHEEVSWILSYDIIFGSTSAISAMYIKDKDVFIYLRHPDREEIRTSDPEEVLAHFRARIDFIKAQRVHHLRKNVQLKKREDVPLETAITHMERFAEAHPRYGPTGEELELYKIFCQEVYSQ